MLCSALFFGNASPSLYSLYIALPPLLSQCSWAGGPSLNVMFANSDRLLRHIMPLRQWYQYKARTMLSFMIFCRFLSFLSAFLASWECFHQNTTVSCTCGIHFFSFYLNIPWMHEYYLSSHAQTSLSLLLVSKPHIHILLDSTFPGWDSLYHCNWVPILEWYSVVAIFQFPPAGGLTSALYWMCQPYN